jgi:hypothetical protein
LCERLVVRTYAGESDTKKESKLPITESVVSVELALFLHSAELKVKGEIYDQSNMKQNLEINITNRQHFSIYFVRVYTI